MDGNKRIKKKGIDMNEIHFVECFTVKTQDDVAEKIQKQTNDTISKNPGYMCVDVKMEHMVGSVLVMVLFEPDP